MLYQMREPYEASSDGTSRRNSIIAATRGLRECPRAWSLLCRDEIETQVITFGGTLLSGERCRSDQARVPLRDLIGYRRCGPALLSDIRQYAAL